MNPSNGNGADPAGSVDGDAVRTDILGKMLELVPFDGWTVETLRRAAKEAGFDRPAQRQAFPRGVIDAISFYSHVADQAMIEQLKEADLSSLKVREKVTLAVRLRIEALSETKEAARRAAGFLSLPMHGPSAARLVYRTVDAIWRAIGDTSTDFDFYTKRTLLAGVYSSTLMHWFSDRSQDSAHTWAFLDRRIANVMQIEKAKAQLRERIKDVPDPFRFLAGFTSGRSRR
jgi:ubiquinone biosynthesis protein COQ9